MKLIPILAAAFTLMSTANAQVLSEDFSSGVPPTGWTHVMNGTGQGWIDGSGRAWHEDENLSGLSSDNVLVSPAMDLSGVSGTTLTFESETHYSAYLANNPLGFGDGVSSMEISTDGGLTWALVWSDASTVDYIVTTESVDLSAYDGMSGVQLGIHFFGTYAQEWWVDDVVVGDGGTGGGLVLGVTGLVSGGTATISLTGATAGGNVMLGYSFAGAGPTQTHFGLLDLGSPIHSLPVQTADAAGNITITAGVAVRTASHTLYAQAADLTSGTLSNAIAEPVL